MTRSFGEVESKNDVRRKGVPLFVLESLKKENWN